MSHGITQCYLPPGRGDILVVVVIGSGGGQLAQKAHCRSLIKLYVYWYLCAITLTLYDYIDGRYVTPRLF